MKLAYSKLSLNRLQEIFAYIEPHNIKAALRILDKIENSCYLLKQSPYLGKPGRKEGTRELYIYPTKYIIVYKVDKSNNTVTIVNILHTSMKY